MYAWTGLCNVQVGLSQFAAGLQQIKLLKAKFAAAGILLEQQNYLEAIIIYRGVIKADPENADAHYQMGLALQGRERKEEALKAFETALKLFEEQDNFEGKEKVESMMVELEN